MDTHFLDKRSRLPTFHSGGRYRYRVDPAALDRDIPTDFLKALSPEQLAAAGDVIDVGEAVIVVSGPLEEERAGNSQIRHLGKPVQEKGEVLLVEAQISIEIADDVIRNVAQLLVSRVERPGLARTVSAFPGRSSTTMARCAS